MPRRNGSCLQSPAPERKPPRSSVRRFPMHISFYSNIFFSIPLHDTNWYSILNSRLILGPAECDPEVSSSSEAVEMESSPPPPPPQTAAANRLTLHRFLQSTQQVSLFLLSLHLQPYGSHFTGFSSQPNRLVCLLLLLHLQRRLLQLTGSHFTDFSS